MDPTTVLLLGITAVAFPLLFGYVQLGVQATISDDPTISENHRRRVAGIACAWYPAGVAVFAAGEFAVIWALVRLGALRF